MFSHCGAVPAVLAASVALAIGGMSGSSAFAQGGGGLFGGIFAVERATAIVAIIPTMGPARVTAVIPAITSTATMASMAIPALASRGAASNPGYDPGYGGYPSYGGYGIANRLPYAAPAVSSAPTQRRLLGIDEEPVVIAGGVKAMKVGKVYPGTAAERAGLQAGDVIRSVNGYLTEQRGNLAWIIANATPNNELKLNVQTAKDGQTHLITATLP